MTTAEIFAMIVPLDEEQKKKLGWPKHLWVPSILCSDGIMVPVKDASANSPGTFAWLKNDEKKVKTLIQKREKK
jgi:hypothetical protein